VTSRIGNKVLIIEDAKSLSQAIQTQLRSQYEIQSDIAYNLAEAKHLLEVQGEQYFICTVDLQLPDCEPGDAVALTNSYNLPSIIFTGQTDTKFKDQFQHNFLVDYVFKTASTGVQYVGWLIHRVLVNSQLKVLVVDDSISARKTLCTILKTQGFNVLEAIDSTSCMEIMHQEPDIIILDEFLPSVLGHDLCKIIRAKYPDPLIQIIGVSSKGDKDTASIFLKCGANDFIMRPFNPEEFSNRINHRADYIEQVQGFQRANEEKNRILGMAAHDLRNPLNFIQHACKRIKKFTVNNTQVEPIIKMLQRSTDSMQLLLEDLLDISAIEMGMLQLHKVTYNLSDYVNDRVEMFTEQANKKSLKIICKMSETTMVEADPSRINQVLDNLISNAIKYSEENNEITIALIKNSDNIRFSITNIGPGIPQEEQKKLFKPFQYLSNKTTAGESSHGLGLSICLRIINGHDGSLHYEDSKPKGSHFYFDLPK
jgi:two-component system sensor histidine kinase/response regulator